MRGNAIDHNTPGNILMSDEDLERADDLRKRNSLVVFPGIGRLDIVDEDDKVLVFALVVALDLWCFSASHD
jgi:hypothetical protein